ncbi:hypothetical protein [Rhodanobacter sp. C05]|uniref:hypothetical protein n=1 Tax=Rhodanobacter sp. C05 TaxID=1945855 RepID=UPI0009D355B6|nr:hypothetical protein [Rhodanobacter sp. C05]OOG36228.1 hypothetical protein B0E51_17835 [Rhodanobacter sp. C05]
MDFSKQRGCGTCVSFAHFTDLASIWAWASSFVGPKVTMAGESFSAWLPYAPSILFAAITASIITAVYFSRSSKASDLKSFAICLIAALNYFFAFFVLMSLVSAYLLANGT